MSTVLQHPAQAPLAREKFKVVPSAQTPSVQKSVDHIPAKEGGDVETRVLSVGVTSAHTPSAVPVREVAASSPTPLEVLAGHRVEAAVEENSRPSDRESPRISSTTKILETEDDSPSEDKEV
ncbi:hypothetical protein AXG93_2528s2360 [Marchantia polymorpha subsp. ruderalis]|uniref:Uncharacterized protein n=1 Tax=Marchantia polymorpha subsp. ruderalis TaxID=1480154 RepID=A0A176WP25_MARPO|nr:hypothetical protein AXG93_2528s2360 [Marchantia polymorpha subsp. ruderalis]